MSVVSMGSVSLVNVDVDMDLAKLFLTVRPNTPADMRIILEMRIKKKAQWSGVKEAIAYLEKIALFSDDSQQLLFLKTLKQKLEICKAVRTLSNMNPHLSNPYLAYELGLAKYTHITRASGFDMTMSLDSYISIYKAIVETESMAIHRKPEMKPLVFLEREVLEEILVPKLDESLKEFFMSSQVGYTKGYVERLIHKELTTLPRFYLDEVNELL